MNSPSNMANNQDLLVWSLYLLDGASRWIDVEDIYLKAFELAPARLSWRSRPDLPDYKKCAKALQSVEASGSPHKGFFVKRSQYLRMLSSDGLAWCMQHSVLLQELYQGGRVAAQGTNDAVRRLREIEQSPVFAKFRKSGELAAELWELAELLRCGLDSPLETWRGRIAAITDAAVREAHHEIQTFVRLVSQRIDKEFKRGH